MPLSECITAGRSEVTALGEEFNEAARIEACATGGRILASKAILERLDRPDAQACGFDPALATYTSLAELSNATEKARRDRPQSRSATSPPGAAEAIALVGRDSGPTFPDPTPTRAPT